MLEGSLGQETENCAKNVRDIGVKVECQGLRHRYIGEGIMRRLSKGENRMQPSRALGVMYIKPYDNGPQARFSPVIPRFSGYYNTSPKAHAT